MLVLPITKKSLDMIISSEIKEIYKDIKPYYDRILGNIFIGFPFTRAIIENFQSIKLYDSSQIKDVEIIFRNGYEYYSPKVKCLCSLDIGEGKKEWGAIPGKEYYILKILKIV